MMIFKGAAGATEAILHSISPRLDLTGVSDRLRAGIARSQHGTNGSINGKINGSIRGGPSRGGGTGAGRL